MNRDEKCIRGLLLAMASSGERGNRVTAVDEEIQSLSGDDMPWKELVPSRLGLLAVATAGFGLFRSSF